MSKRMLIDGAHTEEIRVVVTSGTRLDEYDIETSFKKQIKGNIYLAKVTRVEPSLQAAFVDFGGNRHGFLAFSEIHPDYYQIPVEDRKKLIEEQEDYEMRARAAQEHLEDIDGGVGDEADVYHHPGDGVEHEDREDAFAARQDVLENGELAADAEVADAAADDEPDAAEDGAEPADAAADAAPDDAEAEAPESATDAAAAADGDEAEDDEAEDGEDDGEARPASAAKSAAPRRSRAMRRYKIQEVIKRRQILLVQVVKEERGNKGAALTTYISLAGRYCVLMPNSTRGGGISRKITNAAERRKLRDTLNALDIPVGMGVIIRTAGLERSKAEIRRDFEYLIRAWDEVREETLKSTAPEMVYEEGNIIKRAIRDIYSKDMDEIQVEGADTYQTAKRFMRLMMPSHAKRVQPYRDDTIPLFHRYQIEQQLDAMHNPEVQLKSGGYVVINQTEALVAIDVNSGKSTRERNIEETALKTNLEAADEVARQLRLRDLAGLIVIDFIDMEDSRHIRQVERRLRDAMKVDRARLQIGRISNFGLLELSRQRLRPSLIETSTQICAHCHGTGNVLSTESMAMRVLRTIEDEGIRMRSSEITITVPTPVALYILNQKRASLVEIETRYGFRVSIEGDDSVIPPEIQIDRVKGRPTPAAGVIAPIDVTVEDDDLDAAADEAAAEEEEAAAAAEVEEEKPRRGRRRGRRRSREDRGEARPADQAEPAEAAEAAEPAEKDETRKEAADGDGAEQGPRRRRRGRRGGRRRGRAAEGGDTGAEAAQAVAASPDADADGGAPADPPAPGSGAAETVAVETAETPADPPVAETAGADDDRPEPPPEPELEPETETAPEPAPEPAAARGPDAAVNGAAGANGEAVEHAEDEETTAEEPVTVDEPDPEKDRTPEPAMAESAAADQPKRRGWWTRIVE